MKIAKNGLFFNLKYSASIFMAYNPISGDFSKNLEIPGIEIDL